MQASGVYWSERKIQTASKTGNKPPMYMLSYIICSNTGLDVKVVVSLKTFFLDKLNLAVDKLWLEQSYSLEPM